MNEQIEIELKNLLNNRYSTSESTRGNYARGEDTYDPILSKAVVFPESNEEVSKILKLCNENKIPVIPFGTGTSLEGNVVGNEKGITISLEKMNKILSVNAEALSPSGEYKLCIAVGDKKRGISIFLPKSVVDKSGSPTLAKIFGTRSQSLKAAVFLFKVTSSSEPPSI